jgi:NAD(P)-dependent dehydrogenase (short-subunit alcohol dehydrogenase family)
MPKLLADKVALITGGASGVGRAIATAFGDHGAAAVVIADLQPEAREGGEPTHEVLMRAGVKSAFVETDVTSLDDVEAAVQVALGFGRLDVMVNNAGIYMRHSVFEVTETDLDHLLAVNVKGTFYGCQRAAAAMRTTGGVIINVSSTAANRGAADQSPYSASKGAVRSMSYSLASELAPLGIRVIALHPGLTDTAMPRTDRPEFFSPESVATRPMGVATPQDIANVAVFLASGLAGHVSGTSLTVDGAAGSMG